MNSPIDAHLLHDQRESKGWSQRKLADVAGVDNTLISRLERNLQDDVGVKSVLALAKALELPVEDLLSPSARRASFVLPSELFAVFAEISALSPHRQQHVILILRAYLAGLQP